MYTNLSNQLRAKGLSWNAAAAIGMPEPIFRGKMTVKERSFSIEEAIKIKLNLFPEMDMMYLFKKADDSGYPRLQIIDGGNATGIIDPVINMLTEGYAILSRNDYGNPETEAYFTAGRTDIYVDGKLADSISNTAPYALLVPMIYRPDAKRPFGHSRISRACMAYTQTALRTLKRSEVSAEFYSFPQKYVLGLSEEAEFNNRMATLSSFLNFTKDGDGDHPVVGQFQQQSMTPYSEQLRTLASLFAGETGLTLDDLGFATENPSSAEAIKASHENLRLMARKAQRTFGVGLLNTGYLSACVRDKYSYERSVFRDVKPMWLPIFEPDAAALSGVGDAILKINQAIPGYLGSRNIKTLTGIEADNDLNVMIGNTTSQSPPEQIVQENEKAEVQGKQLNGAQTQSLIAIMSQFTAGSLTEGQAINLISTAIGVSKEDARAILNGSI